jgi:hypothetical protein
VLLSKHQHHMVLLGWTLPLPLKVQSGMVALGQEVFSCKVIRTATAVKEAVGHVPRPVSLLQAWPCLHGHRGMAVHKGMLIPSSRTPRLLPQGLSLSNLQPHKA